MIQTITQSTFIDAFRKSDSYRESFSYNALVALFEYIEQAEEDTGESIEFDMIALCCEWTEYETASQAFIIITNEELEGDDEDEKEANALEYLQDNTQVIEFDGGVLVANF